MSRADLDRIQVQLKVAIQNHQILVAKMKNDPQNVDLKKQLHDMQSEITSLSERQKAVVQALRKELVSKQTGNNQNTQQHTSTASLNVPSTKPAHGPTTLSSRPPLIATSHGNAQPATLNKPSVTQTSIQASSQTKASMKTSHGHSSHGHGTHSHSHGHSHSHSHSQSSIRVPNYHLNRPSILQGGNQSRLVKSAPAPPIPVDPPVRKSSESDYNSIKRCSIDKKELTPETRKKLEYMACLDLVTPDTLKELQRKRSERKRRSTANPQFSYGNFEPERKRVGGYLATKAAIPGVRRRGRPRKVPLVPLPSLVSSVIYEGVQGFSGQGATPYSGHRDVSPASDPPGSSNLPDESATGDVHEDYCAVCYRIGELLMCDTCSLVYHLNCLDPPLNTIPNGLWSCPKCQIANKQAGNNNLPGTLALVHSFIIQKTAKEEEKKKLEKKNQELEKEKSQLEDKAKTLTEQISKQVQQKADLLNSNKTAQEKVDNVRNFMKALQS